MVQTTNKSIPETIKLSILIAQDGLSFCISSLTSSPEILAFEKHLFEEKKDPEKLLEKIQFVLDFQLADFTPAIQELAVIYATTLYSFVPNALFKENQLADYLKFNVKILATDLAAYDELKHYPIKNVFLPFTNINNYLFERFGEFSFTHAASHLADFAHTYQHKPKSATEQVFVYKRTTGFDVCIIKAEKLCLSNTYSCETPADFVYFLLFAFEQLALDPEVVPVYLLGEIDQTDDYFGLLYKYVRKVECISLHKTLTNQFQFIDQGINREQLLLESLNA